MKTRLMAPLVLAALAALPGAAQPARPPASPVAPPAKPADPRTAALLSWGEAIFPYGAGDTNIEEMTNIHTAGWRFYRVEKKYKGEDRMGDIAILVADDRGQTVIIGDAFVDEGRLKNRAPVKSDADLAGMSQQLGRFFRGPFRIVLDPAHDRLPAWKGVSVKLSTGYGEYEVDGFVRAEDGGILLLGRAWDRRRPIVEQRLQMLEVKDAPFQGPEHAKVTIVEFSDMQCGYCKKRTADWEPLMEKLGGQLTIKRYFKFFPLTNEHPWAFRASSAGYCLFAERGSDLFLRFKKQVYSQQEQLTVPAVDLFALDFARANDVPEASFKSCYLGERSVKRILADLTEGFALRVRATPTYFIDGVPVSWYSDDLMEEYLRKTYLKGAGLPLPKPAVPATTGRR